MKEQKENKCSVLFFCNHSIGESCIYFTGKDIFCDYKNERYECLSAVAQVNMMVLMLKDAGFKVIKDE